MTSPTLQPWQSGPATPRLSGADVHVWRAALNPPSAELASITAVLDAGEAERARTCRLPQERARFVAAHGALRLVLARYAQVPAAHLRFGTSERGRPFLLEPAGSRIDFNLSHSAATALIAVARDHRVGIDIEYIDPSVDHLAMARRFFAADDADLVGRLPEQDAREVFFTRWTWRESHAKAVDGPLSHRLDGVLSDRAPVQVGPWGLWDLPVGAQARATLAAVHHPAQRVRLYDCTPQPLTLPAVLGG